MIRNFSIIAHIDHGKSTLADRMLEHTSTIDKRKMQDQMLDTMELERERGITIKMQPVRMEYNGVVFNLIDTPGHIDFSYEVSRALTAVEGVVLLVDCTQGVQAQTLTTLGMARDLGLVIIPVLSKIDSPLSRVEVIKEELALLLDIDEDTIIETSGKTGAGVEELLKRIVEEVPEPEKTSSNSLQGIVFDFEYSNHRGVIVYVRVFKGSIKKGDTLIFSASKEKFTVLETGIFKPGEVPKDSLDEGEIGYIVTGIKKPGIASVGDTLTSQKSPLPALPGYMEPAPVVWASIYPESADDFTQLKQAIERLKLSDSSLSFEEETSGALGRGFRCGFLGMLHLEIITERLHREFDLDLIVTTPSITYEVEVKGKMEKIYTPSRFPNHGEATKIMEPWVDLSVIIQPEYMSPVMQLLYDHEGTVKSSEVFGDGRNMLHIEMPLRELMRNFFDRIKNATSGFASISYKLSDMREADVVRLDILVAEEVIPAFSRVVSKRRVQEEAEVAVEKLYKILPRQMFTAKIQGSALGRILSSKTLSAMKKDVTAKLYGGDITRKMKLREKQKKGKKKMQALGRVNIPQDVFMKMVKSE